MFETSSDVRRHEKALKLHSLLELHDKSHFRECDKEMFLSYPSVLNHVVGRGQALECCCPMCIRHRLHPQDLTASDGLFRQLPNDECLLEGIDHWSSDAHANDVDELHEYAIAHFAASGSSHCAHLNARISAIEDKYLSAEATDIEAADDMNIALQRLREGIARYEVIVRNVSRRCIPIIYSVISCALSVVKSAPLPRLGAHIGMQGSQHAKAAALHADQSNSRPHTMQRMILSYEPHGRDLPPHQPLPSQVVVHCCCKTSVQPPIR